jgi:sec-independent protein translocase protein TatA
VDLGPSELLVILLVVLLLFGAKRLPDIARGSGRALRVFKSEVTGTQDAMPGTAPSSEGHEGGSRG